jgi:pantoate--beta-alanine ligase
MEVAVTVGELASARARLNAPLGLVPTMGALHAGHASLIERARRECASVVVSVFVNPLQFGPGEDFNTYPRSVEEDRAVLESLNVNVMFAPSMAVMYPQKLDVFAEPTLLAQHLEGERRPGHFRGVATVVLKLFNLVAPRRAYFGQKDAQQLAVIQRMVADLNLPVEIVSCETLREPDGLALSSRNAYLTAAERRSAPHLYAALRLVAGGLGAGRRDVASLIAAARAALAPLREDYLAVVRPEEFRPLPDAPPATDLLVVGAAFAGRVRLIDNLKVRTPEAA